jgi:hypothetical protein
VYMESVNIFARIRTLRCKHSSRKTRL